MKTYTDSEDDIGEKQFDLHMDTSETMTHPRVKKNAPIRQTNGFKYFGLAGELGFDIALPIAAGFILGAKIDSRYGTGPKATIGLFIFGLLLSCASLIRIVKDVSGKR
jgi:hypothetical protein